MEGMLPNNGHFRNKTVLISGASRGIGLSIAKKLAADGANISAAKEIEEAGGRCLPCVVDVRSEEAVERAVDEAVKKFGGIDISNRSFRAVDMSDTLHLDMRKFDLMHAVNTRGSFLLAKKCVPHLKKSSNPHILNISPPLLLESQWFAPHVGYTISKFGMSLCVLGMSEEFRPLGIAVNALWPRVTVYTAALRITNPTAEAKRRSRRPEVMADAAYALLQRPARSATGRFAIDEDVLREAGIYDFAPYAFDPTAPPQLDFFLPGVRYDELRPKM
ncbi:SCP2 domain-containing protein [Aphelenchoides fujianensis]|nr:SCP2 domain-containing protein [Aphelenchoides fujianensis]